MRIKSLLALAMTFVVVAALISGCERKTAEPQMGAPVTNAAPAVTPTSVGFEKLSGRWARMDGDYVLDIKSVAASGQMEAAYFNPDPIKVSRALGISEGKETKVFVELRDEGYPGCTYSLTYSAETDQLFGTYFQAAMQETFEVVFSRLK